MLIKRKLLGWASFFCFALMAANAMAFEETHILLHTGKSSHKLKVQWAAKREDLLHGLMFRKTIAPYAGMMFDFGTETIIRMWMKNTPLSLDMVFFAADGRVVDVHEGAEPYSEAIIASRSAARYVLELPAGMADQYQIAAGNHFTHEGIRP